MNIDNSSTTVIYAMNFLTLSEETDYIENGRKVAIK